MGIVTDWFKKIFGKEVPKGRVSIEPVSMYLPKVGTLASFVDPRYPRDILTKIEQAVFNNPILSQVHNLTINLANTGHFVQIIPEKKEAIDEINNLAAKLNIDMLVNALLSQLILYGAISCEIVVSQDLEGIEKIVRVHPKNIWFAYDDLQDKWIPYQWVGSKTIKLNEKTYIYAPLLTIDDSPYAIPPMLASLTLINTTDEFVKELQNLAKKIGLLGFLDIEFPLLPKAPAETEVEYQKRLQEFLQNTAQSVAENITKGVFLHFEGTKAEFKEVSSSISGIKELLAMLEKWTIESAKSQPALLGFSEGYTETWATVSLYIYTLQMRNYQRVIRRVLEYAYRLHLALKGIEVDDINIEFNPLPGFERAKDEEANLKRVQWIVQAYQVGLLSIEDAKQEIQKIL